MIQTLNHNSHLLTKLLILGVVAYAFYHRADIKNYFSHNETIQQGISSLKWAYNELRPATEDEKARRYKFGEEQRKLAAEYKKLGINPNIKYVTPKDPEWKEAAAFYGELMRGRSE